MTFIRFGGALFKEGVKADQGKPRMELLPMAALREVAKVYTFGANKYEDDNWRKGMKWSRMSGAALRHITDFMEGNDIDPEHGLCHLTGAIFSLLCLLTYWLTKTGTDDRWSTKCKSTSQVHS